MHQIRICTIYQGQCARRHVSAGNSFFSLPAALRDRIYSHAGVITGASLRIVGGNCEPLRVWMYSPLMATFRVSGSGGVSFYALTEDQEPCTEDWDAYFNLVLCNRAVQADVARYICSHNELLLCCELETDLLLLRNAPLHLVRSIRSLTIHLDVASIHERRCRISGSCCHRDSEGLPHCKCNRRHLKSSFLYFGNLIRIWNRIITHLATSADLSMLELSVYCDVHDSSVARRIVQPLSQLSLADCNIRLSGMHDVELKSIASLAVDRATQVEIQPFRFLDLPPELRQHVLGFTDVIVPHRRVCVARRTFLLPEQTLDLPECANREFCSLDHKRFPSSKCCAIAVYPSCKCWRPPTPIFLVCKGISHDARALFFASNHIIVPPNERSLIHEEKFEGSFFMRHIIPQEVLGSLRSLELTFSAKIYDFFGPEDHSGFDKIIYEDWKNTIGYIASKVRKLRLRLHMGVTVHSWVDRNHPDEMRRSQQRLFQRNVHIVLPLRKLSCLEFFMVRAYSPFHLHDRDAQRRELREHEEHLETLVMGEKYDDMSQARFELLANEWWKQPGSDP